MARIDRYPLIMERMVDVDLLRQHRHDQSRKAYDLYKYGMTAVARTMGFHHPSERFDETEGNTHEVVLNPYDFAAGVQSLSDEHGPLGTRAISAHLGLTIVQSWIKTGVINPIADFYVGAYWDKDNWDKRNVHV